jgi:hypothetical protein
MTETLMVGAGQVDRHLDDAEELLIGYRTDDGLRYLACLVAGRARAG